MTPGPMPQSLADPTVRLGPIQQLVGGSWVSSRDGSTLPVECPANRRVIAEIPSSGAADIDDAVQAARSAFGAWSRMPPAERGRLLQKIADALDAGAEELARIVAHETGNALRTQSRPEAYVSGAVFRYFGGLASELKGMSLPLGDSVLSYTRREPIGVVGAIVPWNSPVALAVFKIAPALCAGNTVVLKPAEDAPLGVLWMAEVCSRFLPPGVLNVVTGTGTVCGAALVNHPGVDKLTFTGSTGVGKGVLMRSACSRSRSNSAERAPPSWRKTLTQTGLRRPWPLQCGSRARASLARRAHAFLCTSGSLTAFWTVSPSMCRATASAIRWTRPPTWVRSSTVGSLIVCAATSQKDCPRRACARWSGVCPPKTAPSLLATTASPRSLRRLPTTGSWPAKRSSGLCWWPSLGVTTTRSCVLPMTATTAWPPTCLQETRPEPCAWHTGLTLVGCR